jgi:predicted Zn-dependent protease
LGAVAQTRAELSVYSWPEWPIQDEVRRTGAVSLTETINHYQAALALDPSNSTAHRRLGQIELSLGDYAVAQHHLEVAFAQSPHQRVTRQLLGEAYAVTGHVGQAAMTWQDVNIPANRLQLRGWWYRHIGAKQEAMWIAEAIARIARGG